MRYFLLGLQARLLRLQRCFEIFALAHLTSSAGDRFAGTNAEGYCLMFESGADAGTRPEVA